jgi:[ribosomal protein S5]-alanine N-acetyltransferase
VRLTPITPVVNESARWAFPEGVDPGPCRTEVLETVTQTLALYQRRPRESPWLGYLAIDATGLVVGVGGFVNGPDPEGVVEIAYGTFPPFRRRGIGTAIAAALVDIALKAVPRPRLIAHTLPEEGPSPRILRSTGFDHRGTIQHPEDGPVWLWEFSDHGMKGPLS